MVKVCSTAIIQEEGEIYQDDGGTNWGWLDDRGMEDIDVKDLLRRVTEAEEAYIKEVRSRPKEQGTLAFYQGAKTFNKLTREELTRAKQNGYKQRSKSKRGNKRKRKA